MHIGLILDGNRRWAKQRLLPSFAGHKAGFDNVKNIIQFANKLDISHLTLWGLSKENLENRSGEELEGLFSLFDKFFDLLPLMMENNLIFRTIGDTSKLPQKTQDVLNNMKIQTENNTGMTVILALVHSGQDEIVRGIKKAAAAGIKIDELDEKSFRNFLDTADFPQVDLIIRTGGDIRHSGFMLYDSAYSEYAFTQTLLPDLEEKEFTKIIGEFQSRNRRFGK